MGGTQSSAVIHQTIIKYGSAVGIEGICGGAKLIDEAGVELHPLFRALKIKVVQRSIAAVVRQRVRRRRDPHALEQTGIRHAIGDDPSGIGLPRG